MNVYQLILKRDRFSMSLGIFSTLEKAKEYADSIFPTVTSAETFSVFKYEVNQAPACVELIRL